MNNTKVEAAKSRAAKRVKEEDITNTLPILNGRSNVKSVHSMSNVRATSANISATLQ